MQSDIKSRKLDQNSVGDAFKMTREERDISFLNNYFIYKKVRNVDISDIKNALIKSSEAEQVESVKQSLQAAEVVKQTTEQIEDVIESAESIASKPVTSIKIKPIKSKQPKSTKL